MTINLNMRRSLASLADLFMGQVTQVGSYDFDYCGSYYIINLSSHFRIRLDTSLYPISSNLSQV